MTTVYHRELAGRGFHVLIIGVGHYPYCGPRARDEDDTARETEDLTSAPATALAMTRWFLDLASQGGAPDGGEDVPVASVELALSAEAPAHLDGMEIERATLAGVTASFDRWYARCDSPDSIAILYFCGHGLAVDSMQQLLLLEDFSSNALRPYENTVDFGGTYLNMESCAARTQLFFLDTCRGRLAGPGARTRVRATTLVEHKGTPPARTSAPVIHATALGAAAFGLRGRPTHFSAAVRDALGGLAATNHDDDAVWRVYADGLGPAVGHLMRWHADGSHAPAQHVSITGDTLMGDSNLIRVPPVLPPVPFRLGSSPPEAVADAELTLTDPRTSLTAARRTPEPGPWAGQLPAAYYDLRAHFPDGAWSDTTAGAACMPPCLRRTVPVSRP
ncbi:caspase family protein [Streptomyces sp. NPDC090054]|uniref:caspase family protein n=1 Tax=Streptomyces sp. NPDC090054 TaxID=3365933 RepID=UPI0038296363